MKNKWILKGMVGLMAIAMLTESGSYAMGSTVQTGTSTEASTQAPVIKTTPAVQVPSKSTEGYPLKEAYSDVVPDGLKRDLLYTKYALPRHYLVMTGAYGNIRTTPYTKGKYLKKMYRYEKYGVLEAVKGQSINKNDTWYKVFWYQSGKKKTGYIHAAYVVKRQYNFDKAFEMAQKYKLEVEANRIGRISNFRNQNGVAPKYKGKYEEDAFGIQRYQATAAYEAYSEGSDFRYIQDGRVVKILNEVGNFYQVEVVDLGKTYYVPKKYVVESENYLKKLSQVICVDREAQNIIVLSYENAGWRLVSYNQATTGVKDKYKTPTDLGLFMVLNKKPKFDYLDDDTKLIDGYAPYAIRFNGGAFIHGVPVAYIIEKEDKIVKPAVYDANGKVLKAAVIETKIISKKDPGQVEYLSSIGTTPRSHKCVRNYTSHAKFLYDWVKVGESAVVVFE